MQQAATANRPLVQVRSEHVEVAANVRADRAAVVHEAVDVVEVGADMHLGPVVPVRAVRRHRIGRRVHDLAGSAHPRHASCRYSMPVSASPATTLVIRQGAWGPVVPRARDQEPGRSGQMLIDLRRAHRLPQIGHYVVVGFFDDCRF